MDERDCKNLTVRQLAELLAKIPGEYQDAEVYASYEGGCLTGLYEFDPLTVGEIDEGDPPSKGVTIPGD